MFRSAIFSKDKIYRYKLTRIWDIDKSIVVFIGLNPSIADDKIDDPTIRRCINYAKDWGYGGIIMLNIFSYKSTDPKKLRTVKDPVGPENDFYINVTSFFSKVETIVAVWGTHGKLLGRGNKIKKRIKNLYVLGLTKEGYPKHPLYLKRNIKPVKWSTL